MDKKKDASSSSSRKSSSQKKLMLRVHIPVSGSLLFLPFGSWRGLGAGTCFSLTCSAAKGGERCFLPLRSGVWGILGWGVQPVQQTSPPHLRCVGAWGAFLVSAPGAVLGAQCGASVARRSEDNSGCTTTPLPWAVGFVQYVSSSSHADSQYSLAKGLFSPERWSQHPQVWLWELSVPCG